MVLTNGILEVGMKDLKPRYRGFRLDKVTPEMLSKKAREAIAIAQEIYFVPRPNQWIGRIPVTID